MHVKTLEISLYILLAYLQKLWHTGISLLHKVDILHGFRIILFYRTIDKELIAVFEIRNVLKWKYNKIVMMSLPDNEDLRRQRLTSVLSSSKFPTF